MTNWYKNKTKINLVIDAIMLVLLMAIAGLGFLIKYVLIPGYKRNTLYPGDVELYFLGLDRHEWGSIHLWLSFVFIALMMLHIVLHWKMISCIFGQMVKGKASRVLVALCTGIMALFLALAPFFVKPDVVPLDPKHHHKHNDGKPLKETAPSYKNKNMYRDTVNQTPERLFKNREVHSHSRSHDEPKIHGYMSLEEAARKYSIPVSELTKALKIPLNSSNEKIGRLKKEYGFEMEELKETIIKLKNN
jgi:hypothetical protein